MKRFSYSLFVLLALFTAASPAEAISITRRPSPWTRSWKDPVFELGAGFGGYLALGRGDVFGHAMGGLDFRVSWGLSNPTIRLGFRQSFSLYGLPKSSSVVGVMPTSSLFSRFVLHPRFAIDLSVGIGLVTGPAYQLPLSLIPLPTAGLSVSFVLHRGKHHELLLRAGIDAIPHNLDFDQWHVSTQLGIVLRF